MPKKSSNNSLLEEHPFLQSYATSYSSKVLMDIWPILRFISGFIFAPAFCCCLDICVIWAHKIKGMTDSQMYVPILLKRIVVPRHVGNNSCDEALHFVILFGLMFVNLVYQLLLKTIVYFKDPRDLVLFGPDGIFFSQKHSHLLPNCSGT